MKNLLKLGLFLLLCNTAIAQEFPKGPVVPSPITSPSGIILKAKTIYVIQNDTEFFVLTSPSGKAGITYETGPKKYKGEFPDAPGITNTRNFEKKFLVEIDALATYKGLEIFTVPKGVEKAASIAKVLVDLDVVPDDGKKKEEPPIPAGSKTFWVVLVEESGQRTPQIAKIFGDKQYFDSLKPHEWYTTDQNTLLGQSYIAKAKQANVALPAIFLIDTVTEQPVTIKPMPTMTAEITKLIKDNGGK